MLLRLIILIQNCKTVLDPAMRDVSRIPSSAQTQGKIKYDGENKNKIGVGIYMLRLKILI